MKTRYAVHIFWSNEDEGFVAFCEEFPGLSAFGETREEALREAQIALDATVETYRSQGLQLPEPQAVPIAA